MILAEFTDIFLVNFACSFTQRLYSKLWKYYDWKNCVSKRSCYFLLLTLSNFLFFNLMCTFSMLFNFLCMTSNHFDCFIFFLHLIVIVIIFCVLSYCCCLQLLLFQIKDDPFWRRTFLILLIGFVLNRTFNIGAVFQKLL